MKGRFSSLVLLFALTSMSLISGCGPAVTFTVNTAQDLHDTNVGDQQCVAHAAAELCSLRAAVEQSNAFTPGTAHIVINVPADTYNLSAQPEVHLTLNSGRFVEIHGVSPASTIIQPAPGVFSRAIHILGGLFRLENLSIRNTITSNNNGGGILIEGSSYSGEIKNCIIEDNASAFRGGAIYAEGDNGASLLISDTIIRNNQSGLGGAGGGGGGLEVNSGTVFIGRSTISGNLARAHGGGIFVAGDASLTLRDVTVHNNDVLGQAGAGGQNCHRASRGFLENDSIGIIGAILNVLEDPLVQCRGNISVGLDHQGPSLVHRSESYCP